MFLDDWFPSRFKPRCACERSHLRSALRFSNIEATFATIHVALTQGIFLGSFQGVVLTNYLIDLGSSNFICGLVQALPNLTQFAFFVSPVLVRRMEGRRPVVIVFCLLNRLAWAVLIAYLFVPWSAGTRQLLMVVTLLLSNVCAVIAGNAWLGWMADLVPTGLRGAFYGRRNVYLGLASLIALFVGAQALSVGDGLGDRRLGYIFCFGVASVAAVFSSWFLSYQYEPPMVSLPGPTRRRMWADLMKNDPFTRYLRFIVGWQFSLGLAEAYFTVHMVRVLKMSPAQMGVQALLSALVFLVSVRAWGRVLDRLGSKAVLVTAGIVAALHVWVWLLARPDVLWPVWVAAVLAGFAWSGFNLANFNWPQLMTASGERQYALGLLNTVSGLTFLAASLLGGALTTVLPQTLFHVGRYEFVHFHLLFGLSAIGRLIAIVTLATRVPYISAKSHRHTLAMFSHTLRLVIAGGQPRRRPSMVSLFVARLLRISGLKARKEIGQQSG